MNSKTVTVEEVFSLDVRSLALFRVLMGVYIIADAIDKFSLVSPFFSDNGVIPRSLVDLSNIEHAYHLQLSMVSGSEWFGYLYLSLLLIGGILLMVGYKTRIVTIM